MARPLVTVDVAFTSGYSTPLGDRVYTDVTRWVEAKAQLDLTYGRNDEQSEPGSVELRGLMLNNDDGRFTPERETSPYFPNVKRGKPIRATVRYAEDGPANVLTGQAAELETSVAAWTPVGCARALSTARAALGAASMLVTWTGAAAVGQSVSVPLTGLVVGRAYRCQVLAWVPNGAPGVQLTLPVVPETTADALLLVDAVLVDGSAGTPVHWYAGPPMTGKGAWLPVALDFVATARDLELQLRPTTTPTAGQQVWVDAAVVDERLVGEGGAALPVAFSTRQVDDVRSTRFTGYADEWSVIWPNSSDRTCQVEVAAFSRKARLEKAPPLDSSVKETILATGPKAYWPLDETDEVTDLSGRQAFRDMVATAASDRDIVQALASFYSAARPAQAPVVRDGTAGPLDGESMVRFPAQTSPDDIGRLDRYVGSGSTVRLRPGGGLTIELLARITPTSDFNFNTLVQLRTVDLLWALNINVGTDGSPEFGYVGFEMMYRNLETTAVIFAKTSSGFQPDTGAAPENYRIPQYLAATDGQIHHYALTLTGGTVGRFYFDGQLMDTLTLPAPNVFNRPFTAIALGTNTYQSTAWIGHCAAHERVLTDAEIEARAEVMVSAGAPIEQRVAFLAERLGIPDGELIVEPTVAGPLGVQPQGGRGPLEVLNEIAVGTGGALYDDRVGRTWIAARNRRYNAPVAFTLSTQRDEIEGDLKPVNDARSLANVADVTRIGSDTALVLDDPDSRLEHGDYRKSLAVLAADDNEAEAAGRALLSRYAQPRNLITPVTVDVSDLSSEQRERVLAADFGTRFEIASLPSQAHAETIPLFIEGYTETLSIETHLLAFNTTAADQVSVWVLGDPVHGRLDADNRLAY